MSSRGDGLCAEARLDLPTLLDLFQPEYVEDPYPFYSWLRETHPVYWDDPLGCWVVSRYADVVALSTDPRLSEDRISPFRARLSAAKRTSMAGLGSALSDMMLFADAPRHTRLRGLVRGAFTRSAVEVMRPSIERTVHGLIDEAVAVGSMDVVADFSQPMSRTVIADLLDVPQEQRWLLDDWASLLHEFFTLSTAQSSRLDGLRSVFDRLLADQREEQSGSLLGHMLVTCPHYSTSAEEMFANFLLVIDAGQVTTTYLVANAVRALLDRPDQMRLLRDRRDFASAAVELMRFDSSVQFTTRIARTDLTVGPEKITAGDPVTLLLASGNRDPDQFPDPDRLDVTRRPVGQLGFGHGPHFCVGAPLALLEIEVAVGALLDRLDLRRVDEPLRWHDSINFRFLTRLPVTVEPVSATLLHHPDQGRPQRPPHREGTAHV